MTDTKTEQQLFFDQVAKEAAAKPMLKLLHRYFTSGQAVIFRMKSETCTNEALHEFISDAFGIWGGGSLENGWYEYTGGSKPRLLLQDKEHITIAKLEGQQLVAAFRALYRIPENGQMYLF